MQKRSSRFCGILSCKHESRISDCSPSVSLLEALTPTGSFCLTMGSWRDGTLQALGPQDDASALPGVFALELVGKAPQLLEAQVPSLSGPRHTFHTRTVLPVGQRLSSQLHLLPALSCLFFPVAQTVQFTVRKCWDLISALFLSLIFSLP